MDQAPIPWWEVKYKNLYAYHSTVMITDEGWLDS